MAETAQAPPAGNDFQMQPLDLSCPAKKDQQSPEDYSVTRPREQPQAASEAAPAPAGAETPARHHPVYLLHRFKRPRSSDSSSDDRRTTSSGSPDDCGTARHGPARKRFLTKFRRDEDASSAAAQPAASSTPISRRHSDNAPGNNPFWQYTLGLFLKFQEQQPWPL